MGNLDAILAQYEKNTQSNAPKKTKMTDEERLKQYFNPRLAKGENSGTKKIRILSVSEGKSPFVEQMIHSVKVGDQYRKFVCPEHTDDGECPFCEIRRGLLSSGKESDKEIAKDYNTKKTYVVKVIDRDFEEDGPKFWRFNHNWKKDGVFDKLMTVLNTIRESNAPDFTDTENGRDLMLTLSREVFNGIEYTKVTGIGHMDASPLHENQEVVDAWLADERTVEDIFKVKSYDYLAIIAKGGEPRWDKDSESWVDKNESETEAKTATEEEIEDSAELTMGSDSTEEVTASTVVETSEDDEDDLPF